MRTISCATAVSSACSSRAQLAHALGQPLLHRRPPFVGRRGDALDQIGDEGRAAHRGRRGDDRLRAIASSRDRPARARPPRAPAPPRRPASARRRSGWRSRIVIACGSRSRSPGVSAPVTSPRARAWSSAVSSARPNASLNSTSTPGVCRSCSDTLSSTRPRATCFATSVRTSASIAASDCGHPQLQIEIAVVERADRHRDRRALVLARHRRESGHRS